MTQERPDEGDAGQKKSLFELLGQLPEIISDLVRAEIDAIKADLKQKAIRAGIGIGLMAVAAFILLLALIVGVFAGVAGIATVLPWWASALIVFGGLVVVSGLLVLIGVAALKSSSAPTGRAESIQADIRTLRGENRRADLPNDTAGGS